MATQEDKYYLRASYLLTKGGRFAAMKVLDRVVAAQGGDLDLILKKERANLHKNLKRNSLEKLFPISGMTDISAWDITLLANVLLNVFHPSLNQSERKYLRVIESRRNYIAHHPSGSLRLDQFDDFCRDVKKAVNKLCSNLDKSVQDEGDAIINDCLLIPLDDAVQIEELKQKLQDIDDMFILLLAKSGPITEEDLRSMKEEVKRLAEIMLDGRPFQKVKVVKSELLLSASVSDQEDVDLASRILTEVVDAAIRRAGSSADHATIRENVDKVLDDLERMSGVHLEGAHQECVVLTFTCSSNAGLLDLFNYLDGETYKERLNSIASALNEYLQRPQPLFISSEVTSECLRCILDDLRPEADLKEKRTVYIPIQIGTIAGMTFVWNLFVKDGILENLNSLTKVLSSCVGTHLTVKVSLNKEQFKKVFLKIELAKHGSISKVMQEVFDLEIAFYGPGDSAERGKDIFAKAFKETFQGSQIKDEYQAIRLAIQLVLNQIEDVEDVQIKDLEYKRTIRMPITFETREGMRYVWDLFEKGGATNCLNSLSEAVSEHVGKHLKVKASLDIEQLKTALTEIDGNPEAKLLTVQQKDYFVANIDPEKLLNHLTCLTQSNKDNVTKTYNESGRENANSLLLTLLMGCPDGIDQLLVALRARDINQQDLANWIEFPLNKSIDRLRDLSIKKKAPSIDSGLSDFVTVKSTDPTEDESDSRQTASHVQSMSKSDVSEYYGEIFEKQTGVEEHIIGCRIVLKGEDCHEEVTAGPIVGINRSGKTFFLTVCRHPFKYKRVDCVRNYDINQPFGKVYYRIEKYGVCLVKVDSSIISAICTKGFRSYFFQREIGYGPLPSVKVGKIVKKIGSVGITTGVIEGYPYRCLNKFGDYVNYVVVSDPPGADESQSFADINDTGSAIYTWSTHQCRWCCIGLLCGVVISHSGESRRHLAIPIIDIFIEFNTHGIGIDFLDSERGNSSLDVYYT